MFFCLFGFATKLPNFNILVRLEEIGKMGGYKHAFFPLTPAAT